MKIESLGVFILFCIVFVFILAASLWGYSHSLKITKVCADRNLVPSTKFNECFSGYVACSYETSEHKIGTVCVKEVV